MSRNIGTGAILAGATLVLCAIALWALLADPAPSPPPTPILSPILSRAAPETTAPSTGPAAEVQRDTVLPPSQVEAPPSLDASLRVRLRGLHADAAWTTPLLLLWNGRDEAANRWLGHDGRAAPDANGLATFALPAWVLTASNQKGRIGGQDPNYLPLKWNGSRDLAQELVLDVQVCAAIEGRVVTTRGEPVEAARVAVLAIAGGVPQDGVLGTTNTDSSGAFRLQVPPAVPLQAVACAMRPMLLSGRTTLTEHGVADNGEARSDLLPAATSFVGAVGKPTRLADLVLPDAATLSGVAQWANGRPVPGAHVVAMVKGGTTLALNDSTAVQWTATGGLALVTGTTSDGAGFFALPGHAGTPVTVAVDRVEGSLIVGEWPKLETTAPQRVVLEVPLPIIVRVVQDGVAVPLASVEFRLLWNETSPEGSTWPSGRTDDEGQLRLVATLPQLRLRGCHRALRSPWVLVDTATTRSVELPLAEALTEVAIEFTGEVRVRNASFRWTRDDGATGEEHLLRDDSSGPFRLFLEPGRYTLQIRGAGGERNGLFLITTEHALTVAMAPQTLTLPAVFGGRFVVHATDSRGLYVAGTCRVFDANGEERTDRFVVRSSDTANVGIPAELMSRGPNEFSTILPPGEYVLEFDFPEHGALQQRVKIRPRDIADVRIRLP